MCVGINGRCDLRRQLSTMATGHFLCETESCFRIDEAWPLVQTPCGQLSSGKRAAVVNHSA